MAQATVGSLNVVLGMDAGDFDRAVRQVQGTLDKLAARFAVIGGLVSSAMDVAADSIGEALAAIPAGMRKAIDSLDKLDEASQKVGLSVAQLDKFKFIAESTGLSMETFEQTASRLSKTMSEIASGDKTSNAALAFQAIGVSVTTTSGQLKSFDVVLADVAEKFAGYRDGVEKTALATQLFGKSGIDLIPTLNEGAEGIRNLTSEYEKLPPASAETAAAAAHFNDTLSKLSDAINRGFFNAISKALPFLQEWADWLREDNRLLNAVDSVASAFTSTVMGLITQLSPLVKHLIGLGVEIAKLPPISETARGAFELFIGTLSKMNTIATVLAATFRGLVRDIGNALDVSDEFIAKVEGAKGAAAASGLQGFETPTTGETDTRGAAPTVSSTQAATEARRLETEATNAQKEAQALHNAELQKFNTIREEGKRIYEETLGPLEQLAAAQVKMNEVNRKGGLLAHEYAAAQQKATLVSLNAYAGMASGIAGNLSKLFGESKAFAIAQAVINTAEAVTKTLATYGATPWGIAAAAAAAAAGAAQIAAIKSSNKGGGGGGSSAVSTDVGSSAGSGGSSGSGTATQQSVFLQLNGSSFGREAVIGLIDEINAASRDGHKILVTTS